MDEQPHEDLKQWKSSAYMYVLAWYNLRRSTQRPPYSTKPHVKITHTLYILAYTLSVGNIIQILLKLFFVVVPFWHKKELEVKSYISIYRPDVGSCFHLPLPPPPHTPPHTTLFPEPPVFILFSNKRHPPHISCPIQRLYSERNWDKNLKTFGPSYSQSLLQY